MKIKELSIQPVAIASQISEEQANNCYHLLVENYRNSDSYTAKARELRAILERFFCQLMGNPPQASLVDNMNRYFTDVRCPYILRDTAHTLRQRLNDIVHHTDQNVSLDNYMLYFNVMVRIIYIISYVTPSDEIIRLLGLDVDQDPYRDLTDEQRGIVCCSDQIINVDAGPGTGKTRLIIYKLLYYINNSTVDNPERIVALSYTNNAAREINDRFYDLQTIANLRNNIPYDLFCGTIHGYCLTILKEFYQEKFDVLIIDQAEYNDLKQEEEGVSQKELLERYRVISIDDILKLFLDELGYNEDFRRWLSTKITTIVVDESQDLNQIVYDIIGRIYDVIPNLKLLFVGDPRQNIYRFIGGAYTHLQDFLNGKQHTYRRLTYCWRCPNEVLNCVNQFNFQGNIPNIRLNSDRGGYFDVKECEYSQQEIEYVINKIQSLRNIKGVDTKCAILASNRYILTPFCEKLNELGIPFKAYGGARDLKRNIKMYNHILRLVSTARDVPFSRRKISEEFGISLTSSKDEFNNTDIGIELSRIRNLIVSNRHEGLVAIKDLLRKRSIGSEEEYNCLIEKIEQCGHTDEYFSAITMGDDIFAEFYNQVFPKCQVPVGGDYVVVSTIHAAKGLEWDNVFVVGATTYNFGGRNVNANEIMHKLYVAATRAKVQLHLSYSMFSDRGMRNEPLCLLDIFRTQYMDIIAGLVDDVFE